MKIRISKKSIVYKFTIMLLLTMSPIINANEVSFASAQLVSDQVTSTGIIHFANLESVDIDGDGDKDIVVSQTGDDVQLSWLENDGGDFSNFPVHVISDGVIRLVALQVADIESDGDFDILAVSKSGDELLWYENDGTGDTWTSHTIQSGVSVNSAYNLSIADIDGDGDLDVVVAADDSSKLYWYENSNNADTWTEHDTGIVTAGAVSAVATGDFIFNGVADIAYGLVSGAPKLVLVGNLAGDGSTWGTSTVLASSGVTITDIQMQDLDLDGAAEIYYHGNNGDLDQLTYDFSTTTWSSLEVISSGVKGKISFADMDNDGDLDVLAGSSNNLSWHENADSMGGSWIERSLATGLIATIESIHPVDLDQDGDMEIITANDEYGYVYAYDNLFFHSEVSWNTTSIVADLADTKHVVIGKLNSDQYIDIVVANNKNTGMEVVFHPGNSAGNFVSSETILSSNADTDISAIGLGDLDGDGDLDIAIAAEGSESIYMIENLLDSGPFDVAKSSGDSTSGMSWGSLTTVATGSGKSQEIQIVDINQDGKNDIVILSQSEDQVMWLDNDGSWTEYIITTNSNNPSNLKVADMNGDGTPDVVTSSTSSIIKWFSNDEILGGTWDEESLGGFTGYQIDLADMDNDGDVDVVASRISSQDIIWFSNDGDGSAWTDMDTQVSTGSQVINILVMDVDIDGDKDIMIQDENGQLSLVENTDPSTDSWALSAISTGLTYPQSLALADYDRDGDIDIITTGSSSPGVYKVVNNGGQFTVAATNAPAQNIEETETKDVISITVTHNGEFLDGDMQLSKLHLGVLKGTGCGGGSTMNSVQFNPLISDVSVYVDDGSGVFELFSDTLVYNESGPFTLISGQLTLNLPDQDSNLQISPQASKDYFVTLKVRSGASSETCHGLSVNLFVSNNTDGAIFDTTRAQDRDSGLELNIASSNSVAANEQLIIASVNNAPTTTGIADQNATEAVLFSVDVSADFNDTDGDNLFYTAIGLPMSMSIDSSTGIISGTPTNVEAAIGTFNVTVVAKDPQGAAVNSMFVLTVVDVNVAPVFSGTIPDQNASHGVAFTLVINTFFNDPDSDVLNYTSNALPDGLVMSASGVISGTPTALAVTNSPYAITVTATDPDGLDISSNSFAMTVASDVIFADGME